ncbi:MAG: RNA polymerase sigma-70 factor (family 1) [Cyclobacteriaceae bacterium]
MAEDIVLDMFTHLWQKRDSLAEITSIEKFLYVSTKNKAIDNLRLKKELISLDAGSDNYKEFITQRDPEKLLIEEELFNTINEAVLALPEKCKLVYRMVKEEGLKYKEVAELLDISPKTVDNQVNHAMKKIRKVLVANNSGRLQSFSIHENSSH